MDLCLAITARAMPVPSTKGQGQFLVELRKWEQAGLASPKHLFHHAASWPPGTAFERNIAPFCCYSDSSVLHARATTSDTLLPHTPKQRQLLLYWTRLSLGWHNGSAQAIASHTSVPMLSKINRAFIIMEVQQLPFCELFNVPKDWIKAWATKRGCKLYFLFKKLANGSFFP